MTQDELFVGIDVDKHYLVTHVHPRGLATRFENSRPGRIELARWLRKLSRGCVLRVGFEASGGYERPLAILLEDKGFTAYLLDARQVHAFGKFEGKRAKTDPLDAALIARALASGHHELTPWRHNPVAERMAERVRVREALVAQIVTWKGHLESLADPAVRRVARHEIARLEALVMRIEQTIADLIAANPELAQRVKLLRSAPGVGPVTAATLIAHMPELGTLTSRQAGALAGLAPLDRQSGATRKPSRCHGGRPQIRRVLYMAAMAVIRSGKSTLANLAKRLKANGRPAKIAIIATARKLLVTLNAMLKNDTAFAG